MTKTVTKHNFSSDLFKFGDGPDLTDLQYTIMSGVTPTDPALKAKFDEWAAKNAFPLPPWDAPFAVLEVEAIKAARDRQDIGKNQLVGFQISWLAQRYGCSTDHVAKQILYSINKNIAWAAFHFRFDPKYRFDSKSLFPGEKRENKKVFRTADKRSVSQEVAEQNGISGFEVSKRIRESVNFKPVPVLNAVEPFAKEVVNSICSRTISDDLIDFYMRFWARDYADKGHDKGLDEIRMELWNFLVVDVYGVAGRTATWLTPPEVKLKTLKKFSNRNKKLMSSLAL